MNSIAKTAIFSTLDLDLQLAFLISNVEFWFLTGTKTYHFGMYEPTWMPVDLRKVMRFYLVFYFWKLNIPKIPKKNLNSSWKPTKQSCMFEDKYTDDLPYSKPICPDNKKQTQVSHFLSTHLQKGEHSNKTLS